MKSAFRAIVASLSRMYLRIRIHAIDGGAAAEQEQPRVREVLAHVGHEQDFRQKRADGVSKDIHLHVGRERRAFARANFRYQLRDVFDRLQARPAEALDSVLVAC